MKCKVCGAYNKSDYIKCIRCGNTLLSDEDAAKQKKILVEHKSPLKNTPTFREAVIIEEKEEVIVTKDIKPGTHKNEPNDLDLWHSKKKKHHSLDHGKNSVPVVSLMDESETTPKEKDDDTKKIAKTRRITPVSPAKGTNLHKLSKIREGQEIEVILPPEAKQKKTKKKKKKKNLKWGRIILVSAIAGVLIVGMIIGFVYLFRGALSGMSQIFAGHEELPNGGVPLVERVMINGETWHRITFYGEDGERVLVDEPIRSLSIQDNKAVLLLDDSSFIP